MIECQFCHQINTAATNELERLHSELDHLRLHEYDLKRQLEDERAKSRATREPLEVMKAVLDAIDNATAKGTMDPHLVRAANMLDVYIRKNGGWK